MKLVFWQNIISPHQVPYIKELAKSHTVLLIVSERMSSERKKMGWSLSDIGDIKLLVSPSSKEIEYIYECNLDAYHLYSGITAFDSVKQSFEISLFYNVERCLISERPSFYKGPKFLHYFKTLFTDYRYFKFVNHVFAFGHDARRWFKFWGKDWEVHNFSYSTNSLLEKHSPNRENFLKAVYVGSLIPRKNVKTLINALSKKIKLDIIGDGIELHKLQSLSDHSDKVVRFRGFLSSEAVHGVLSNYDVLILPSLHDGWGAVVNEALQKGLYVIVSRQCGSSCLVANDKRLGSVFDAKKQDELKYILQSCVDNLTTLRSDVEYRQNWSKYISASSLAQYMISCLSPGCKVEEPWANNSY